MKSMYTEDTMNLLTPRTEPFGRLSTPPTCRLQSPAPDWHLHSSADQNTHSAILRGQGVIHGCGVNGRPGYIYI